MDKYDDSIINNSFDNIEYGVERCSTTSTITISPFAEDLYEEASTEKIEDLYIKREIQKILADTYEESEYFTKYGKENKHIERKDMCDIYYYFKNCLDKYNKYDCVQIFCGIAEFFEFNYKILYNDILTLVDKSKILEQLQEQYGLHKSFSTVEKLF